MSNALLTWMKEHDVPITRDVYIQLAWGNEPPSPWMPEHEAELPEQLQDHKAHDSIDLNQLDLFEDLFDPEKITRAAPGKYSPHGGEFTGKGSPYQRWEKAHGGAGREFVSPNISQVNLAQAVQELKGPRQSALHRAGEEIDRSLDIITHDEDDAIGAWADGAEHSIVSCMPNESWEKLKVSAAMKGYLADQKAVLVFKQQDDGASVLYHFDVGESDVQKLHESLLTDGVAFHTIVPYAKGSRVYVADLDASAYDAVDKAAERYNAKVTYETGQAEFIGTTKEDGTDREQRDDARRAYAEVIQQSQVPGSQEVWDRVHNHWGETLGVSSSGTDYGLVPGDVEKFKTLKNEWGKLNNAFLEEADGEPAPVDDPTGPKAKALLARMETICKEVHGLHADPGGPGGIGLPGGPKDVLIIGAGPAGLTAAVNGAAEGLDTMLIEANLVPGGQAKFSSRVENLPGYPVGVRGKRLMEETFAQVQRLGAETKLGTRVTGMTVDADGMKHVTLSNGETVDSRTVIIAGGVEFIKLPFEGDEGPGVILGDPEAMKKAAKGGSVVVIGGSNGGAQAALDAAQTAEHVYLLSRSPIVTNMSSYVIASVRNNPRITVIENDQIAKLWRDEHGDPQTVETKGGQKLPAQAVGVFVGSVPKTDWVPAEIKRGDKGPNRNKLRTKQIEEGADEASEYETAIPGVYAVGDMRVGGAGRIGVAVGEGQFALRQANSFLSDQRKAAGLGDAAPTGKTIKKKPSDQLITDHFDLDREYPWLGQTIEDDGEAPRSG